MSVEACIHAASISTGAGAVDAQVGPTPCDLQSLVASQPPAPGGPQDTCWVLVSVEEKGRSPTCGHLHFSSAPAARLSCSANVGKEGLQQTGAMMVFQGQEWHLSRTMNFWDSRSFFVPTWQVDAS